MGKSLIIRGADFSENGIAVVKDFHYDASQGEVFTVLPATVGSQLSLSGIVSDYTSPEPHDNYAMTVTLFKDQSSSSAGSGSVLKIIYIKQNGSVSLNYTFTASEVQEGYVIRMRFSRSSGVTGKIDGYYSLK